MEKAKVLVIEDNTDVRENIAEILELSNYDVIEANDGKEGVEKAFTHLPDLILCDVMMPELDGFGVLRILNHDIRTYDIPFIFLTAKSEKADFRKGMGLGADDYITKPFEDTELLDVVEIRLNKRRRLVSKQDTNVMESLTKFQQDLQIWLDNREKRRLSAKDTLYEEGQPANYLYFINEGKFKSFLINEFGKELITGLHKKDEFLGYLSILQGTSYNEHAEALEESIVTLVPKQDFTNFLHENRTAASQFLRKLAKNITKMELVLLDIAFSSVRKRLSNALLELSQQYESDTFSITRENLANLIGTAKETLIRTLSDFKDENLILLDQNKITLLNKSKLQNMPQ